MPALAYSQKPMRTSARALDHNEIGNGAEHGQVSGQRGRHSQREPCARRVDEARDDAVEDEHGRHVADQVGECRGEERHGRGAVEMEAGSGTEEIIEQADLLHAGNDDEEADEHHQQGPIDLAVDALGLQAARDPQERAGDDGDFRHGPSNEEGGDHDDGDGNRLPEQGTV
jgi:hypothetical protein